jgi:diguanylate cyclase (GGDEF)-like protein/PAS domain S-box-containing protein
MSTSLRILLAEDSEDDALLLLHELRRGGFEPVHRQVETEGEFREALAEGEWDVIASDYDMPRLSAPVALEILKQSGRDLPFIVVSGVISMERAVTLMKAGAHDFVEKSDLARLGPAIQRCLREAEEHRGRMRAEELLKDAIENMADGFALFDAEDRFVVCNENYRTIMSGIDDYLVPGMSFEEMTRAFAERGLMAVDADDIETWVQGRIAQHRAAAGFHEHRFSDGRWIRLAERRTGDGGLVCIRTDITERKQAEVALREGEERYRTLYEKTPVMLHSIDADSRLVNVSEYWLETLGYERDEVIGRNVTDFFTEDARRHSKEVALPQFFRTGSVQDVSLQVVKKNGNILDVLLSSTAQHDPDSHFSHSLAVLIDVTERKRAEAHIEHMALHDSLTGLANRFLFHDRLQTAVSQSARTSSILALLFLDLDDFKDVNDTLGHDAGDDLLKAVAERLTSYLRDSDSVGRHGTTLARLGGDEFTILLTNLTDPVGAATVAERIIDDLSRPFSIAGQEVRTGICTGIAIYPDHAATPEDLLKRADLALYRSKAEGRNRYHFYNAEMETKVLARRALERDLRDAIAKDQMWLAYQPLLDIKNGQMVGMEALLRWNHPDRGSISPVEFIPIAETTGLIVSIGKWVLREACRQNKAWQAAGLPPLAVSVNFSAVQFRQEDLVSTVEEALVETGLESRYLHMEITESVLMQEGAVDNLRDFHQRGIMVSLDDFGTGYSSLSYLTQFPVDKIKLDSSFVHEIDHDTSNAAIIKAVVNLGHSLGMRVNVEGVETREQLEILASYGVDEIQGYYFSRPIEADVVPEFLGTVNILPTRATNVA